MENRLRYHSSIRLVGRITTKDTIRMYDQGRISERLDHAEAQLGWRPVYHSVEEVEMMRRDLDAIATFDDAGAFKETIRPFTQKEINWIRNERMLCACDASYFLTRYAYIKDEKNNIRLFSFRAPQRIYFNIIAELERRGQAIQLQILKARQLGMSTITELLVAHRILFTPGVNAVIASSAQVQTKIMQGMIFLVYDRLPYWIRPREKMRQEGDRGGLILHGMESGVSFQHGSQKTGIARGTTPTVIHLSECAGFLDPENTIEASLFNAVHESPGVFMVLESTAEGVDNWWHKQWKSSKSGWADRTSKLCPLFLPWYIGTDIYPTRTWIQTRPIKPDWIPSTATREMMAKAKLFVSTSPLLRDVLGDGWEMGSEQAWYWEKKYEEASLKGMEKKMMQELPGDDIECFQGSFDSVFGNDLIEEIHANRTKEYGIYQITGEGIEDKFNPFREDIDDDKPHRILQYKNKREDVYRWMLVPIRNEIVQIPDDPQDVTMDTALEEADCKLFIFHEPRRGMDYSIGVDSGQGVGGDATVISVWAKGQGGAPDIQCAEFASRFVSHVEAYPFVMAIATLYKKFMEDGRHREPLVSIEVLAAVGDMVQLQMSKMGYSRFHQFIRYDTANPSKKDSNRRGWFTTGWSRPLLVDGFVHSVKNGWVEIHSPFLLSEMARFEVHRTGTGKERLEHAAGSRDDRVFGSAIAVFTAHDLDLMIERGKKRYIPSNQINKPKIDLGSYNPGKFVGDQRMSDQIKSTRDIENLLAERFY